MEDSGEPSKASLRWKILRKALVPHSPLPLSGNRPQLRRTVHWFDLIPFEAVEDDNDDKIEGANSAGIRDITTSYKFVVPGSPKLLLT